ncbi:MAG TPA: DUF6049 family protein [Actinomycetales bacterium]|nr:DUF6049 family protein [Actinomycetales bacterium]
MTRVRRALLVAFLALLTTVGALPAAEAAPAEPSPGARSPGVHITLENVAPTVLTPADTLNVRAVVHNDTPAPLTEVSTRLWVRRARSSDREALNDWVTGQTSPGNVVKTVPLPDPLPSGAQRAVDLTVPAADLQLPENRDAWGPRGLAVDAVDAAGSPLAVTRSFLLWMGSPGGFMPTKVSVLVPFTDGPPNVATGRLPVDRIRDQISDGGRLRNVLAAASVPGVTWALDPALLEEEPAPDAATQAGSGPSPSAGGASTPGEQGGNATQPPGPREEAGPELTRWREDLAAAAQGHEVVTLPYGDPDLNALAHAGEQGLYELAEQQGRDTVQQLLRLPGRTDIAWPASGSLDNPAVQMLVSAGRSSVVLSGGAHPPAARLGITVTGRSTIQVGSRTVSGLLVDTPLSATLASLGTDADSAPTPRGTGSDTSAGAPGSSENPAEPSQEATGTAGVVQRLLAETAAITLERPFDPRHVLVAAPRGWAPDDQAGAAAVRALTSAPWTQASPLGELVQTAPPDVERAPLRYPAEDRRAELPAAGLHAVRDALASERVTATVLTDPQPMVAAAERSAVAATATGWRGRLDEWRKEIGRFTRQAEADADALRVLEGSDVTVVSSQVQLPVTVENKLPQEAQVQVNLRATTQRLVVPGSPLVSVPAESQRRLTVPVRAVANGNTDVVVQLLTPGGEPIGDAVTMTVRVRADWETRGTLVVGAVVGLVLVIGVIRGIRDGRRQRELRSPDLEPHQPTSGTTTRSATDADAAATEGSASGERPREGAS